MAIEKINFEYPKGSLQSVFDHEEMTALELASKTSKKVDECVELVNGVEQSAIEATAIVDEMRDQQNDLVTQLSETVVPTKTQEYIDLKITDGTFSNIINQGIFGQINADIDALEVLTQQHTTNINTINLQHTNDVTALDGRLDTAETNVGNLQTLTGQHTTDITALDGRLDTAETNVGQNASNIVALDNRLDSLETNVGGITGGTLTALTNRVTVTENDIAKIKNTNDFISVKNYGAIGDGASHPLSTIYGTLAAAQVVYPFVTALTQEIDYAATQKALNENDNVYIPAGRYVLNTTVVIPQARFITIAGAGNRKTVIEIADNLTGFNYLRDITKSGMQITFKDCQFLQPSHGKTSTAIKFYGVEDGGIRYHDNSVRVYDCNFYWLKRGVDMKYAGQSHFVGNYAQYCGAPYFLGRDASFLNFNRCMNLDNEFFIYGDDPTPDGISNGITIIDCQSVLAASSDIRIKGWQAIYIYGCGFDLGSNNLAAAVWLSDCMDFAINSCWISSNNVAAPSRNGIHLYNTHTGVIDGCSIGNNAVGIRIDGNVTWATMVSILNNKFEGNTLNDILFLAVTSTIVKGNKHHTAIPRSDTNVEIYANTDGTDYNIITENIMRGATYTIVAGINSVTTGNIFGLPV